MTMQDPALNTGKQIDPDLLRRTESAILAFMAEQDGRMPTVAQVNKEVRTSFTRLSPAVRQVKERLLATQTKLANMPEIPEDLRLAHEQLLKDMWAKTRDLQNGEILDLRRAQTAKDEAHRQALEEAQEVITIVEAARDREAARADAAEAERTDLGAKLETLEKELAAANARLAERETILAMLGQSPSPDAAGAESSKSQQGRKSSRRSQKTDEPETGELPMKQSDLSGGSTAAE